MQEAMTNNVTTGWPSIYRPCEPWTATPWYLWPQTSSMPSVPSIQEQMGADPISKLAAAIEKLAAALESTKP